MRAAVAAILWAGIPGLACNSGLKTSTGDASAAKGGLAGSFMSGGAGGGSIGSGGAGGAGTGDTSGAIGSGGISGTDASVDVGARDAGYCGDGIVETYLGEACDLGALNGVCLDLQMNPVDAGSRQNPEDLRCPDGTGVVCTTGCFLFLPVRS